MKYLRNFTAGILGATILSLGLYSCSNDETVIDNTAEQQTAMTTTSTATFSFIEMALPAVMLSDDTEFETVVEEVVYTTENGVEIEGQIRFRIPDNDFKIVSIEFSQDLLDVMEIDENYFIDNSEDLLEAYGNPDDEQGGGSGAVGDDRSHGERLKWCYDNFEKGQGRGDCKAGEWVTTIGKALKGILSRK